MSELFDPYLVKTFKKDKVLLENAQIPIVTVSASFKEDLKKYHGYPDNETTADIVFSRAHYSMAAGIAITAWGKKLDPTKAWIVDPTNYVSYKNWSSIVFTQAIGKTLARYPFLKMIKDFIDKFARQRLPILKSITPPLLHLTEHIKYPILSLHIAAGNILIGMGKRVVQVITDPHVRDEYVFYSDKKNVLYCVFDEQTKTEFLEKAALLGKEADPERIIVTGPPIDPRILACRETKLPWRSGCLNICITTGGLGTNKDEIEEVLGQLLPELRKQGCIYKLLVYTGTQLDIFDSVKKIAKENRVSIGKIEDSQAKLRVIYHPQLVDANELLVTYGFPWAHGFITKPSGDMAYDAATSGSFILTLAEWGEWEERIREVFEQKNIARVALTENIVAQLEVLMSSENKSQSWIEKAMLNAQKIDSLFLHGAEKIIAVTKSFKID